MAAFSTTWVGRAAPVTQEDTITIGGTWANGDTVSVTCDNVTLTVTVATGFLTTGDVANALNAAINASTPDDDIQGAETRNIGGQQALQFRDFRSEVSGSVVTVIGNTAGEPFTISVGKSSASGTVTLATGGTGASIACTGPNYIDNGDNWFSGSVPASGTLYFNQDAPDCKYALDYFLTNTVEVSFWRTTDFRGNIGLDDINPRGYREYRQKDLQLYRNLGTINVDFWRGREPNLPLTGGGFTRLDCDGQTMNRLRVNRTFDAGEKPSIIIKGGDWTANTMVIKNGFVVLDPADDLPSTASLFGNCEFGLYGNPWGGLMLFVGTIEEPDGDYDMNVHGGLVDWDSLTYKSASLKWDIVIDGAAEFIHRNFSSNGLGAVTAYNGGKFNWAAPAGSQVTGQKFSIGTRGTLDLGEDPLDKTINTTMELHGGATVQGYTGQAYTLINCTEQDVKLVR